MFVLALEVDLRLPAARSLKDKRQVIRSILDTARRRYQVAAAEIGSQDQWQRALLGFAAVSASEASTAQMIDSVDRLLWSYPDVHVLDTDRRWLE